MKKVVASTDEYTILQRRDGRYAVIDAKRAAVNGDAKVEILLKHELIQAPPPKAPEPEPEAESPAENASEGDADSAEESADADAD